MNIVMKRLIAIVPLLALLSSALWADFSRSHATLHPRYPGTGPFIIEISGTWPSDCHPGEQKPLVESFAGRTVRENMLRKPCRQAASREWETEWTDPE